MCKISNDFGQTTSFLLKPALIAAPVDEVLKYTNKNTIYNKLISVFYNNWRTQVETA